MKIRTIGLSLALIVAGSTLTGCENFNHALHPKEHATKDPTDDANSVIEVKPETPRGFFKSTRLPGAMSDEGREIEKNLGVQ